MEKGWSEMVREVAERDFVEPVLRSGGPVRIVVGDLEKKLRRERGFPPSHINQICSALESEKFMSTQLELRGERRKPRRVNTVYEFNVRTTAGGSAPAAHDSLMGLAGILRGAIREGADAFVREIRRDKGAGE